MDNGIKITISGVGGLLLGLTGGCIATYLYTKRYFQEQNDASIKEMAEYYNKKYGLGDTKNEEKCKDESDETVKAEEEIQAEFEKISDIYKSHESDKEEHTAYNDFFVDNKPSNSSTAKKSTKKKKKVTPGVEIVDESIWDENPEKLETKFLIYYDADSILVDEETDILLSDRKDIIDLLDNVSDGTETVIVRDYINKLLYHVTIEQMSFEETEANE